MQYDEIIRRAYVEIKRKLFEQIDSYIEKNFVVREPSGIKFSIGRSEPSRVKKLLDRIMGVYKQTFPEYLLEYIAERGLSEVEVYKKAHLDRRLLSKLRNEKDYMPSERTLWAIALAMELNLDEALDLLNKGGYTLTKYNKEDLVIKFFFENQIYDLFLVNEVLDHYGFKPL